MGGGSGISWGWEYKKEAGVGFEVRCFNSRAIQGKGFDFVVQAGMRKVQLVWVLPWGQDTWTWPGWRQQAWAVAVVLGCCLRVGKGRRVFGKRQRGGKHEHRGAV